MDNFKTSLNILQSIVNLLNFRDKDESKNKAWFVRFITLVMQMSYKQWKILLTDLELNCYLKWK